MYFELLQRFHWREYHIVAALHCRSSMGVAVPRPPIIDHMAAYQRKAIALNSATPDRERSRSFAVAMREEFEQSARGPEDIELQRLARQEFRGPATEEQDLAEHEMFFASFYPFWKHMRKMNLIVSGWPAFGTARLGQTSALSWTDGEGNAAVLFSPLVFELGGFLGAALAPILVALRDEEDGQTEPRPIRDLVLSNEESLQALAGGILEILRRGVAPRGRMAQVTAEDDLAAAGSVVSSLSLFLLAHEFGHIVGEHFRADHVVSGGHQTFEEIVGLLVDRSERLGLETTWRRQEAEIDADLLALLFAQAAFGPIDAPWGPLAWLMLMDILEYQISFIRHHTRVPYRVSSETLRALSILHGRDHPPPECRVHALFESLLRSQMTVGPSDTEVRARNARSLRRRFDVLVHVMGFVKSGLCQITAESGRVTLAEIWQRRSPHSLYPALAGIQAAG